MRSLVLTLSLGGAVTVLALGCNGKTAPPPLNPSSPVVANGKTLPVMPDTVARITVAEAKQAVDSGQAVIVDVREPSDYRAEHIKGAISLPSPQTGSRVGELPKDKLLITYCSCPNEHTSIGASQMYHGNGIYNTAALVGGTNGWKSAGYPMATGDTP